MSRDEDSLNAAVANALAFSGPYARIAALPDIVDVRLRSTAWSRVWNRRLTAISTEYVGYSRQCHLVLAVAHGTGPLVDRVELPSAGAPEADADRRVDRQDFLNLLDGLYGPVAVIDLPEYLRRYRLPFQEMLTLEQAAADPLVLARLGPQAVPYLERQLRISQEWIRDNGGTAYGNRCVLSLRDADDFNYCWTVDATLPVGHFLEISGLIDCEHGHMDAPGAHASRITEIACRSGGEALVIGIRGEGELTEVHPGEDLIREAFAANWRGLLRPNRVPPGPGRIYGLVRRAGLWFTRHERPGPLRPEADPEFPVVAIDRPTRLIVRVPVGEKDPRRLPVFRQLAAAAPPWTNAFHLREEPRTVWKGDAPSHIEAIADFYRVRTETGWRLPPLAALRREPETLLRLTAGGP